MSIYEKLMKVQVELKAPKNQYNSFGKYKYRSCEDILEGVKPYLKKYGLCLTLSDDIVEIGSRIYVKATASVYEVESKDGTSVLSSSAYAREDEIKKGMDGSQVTGSSSSYARKYALNGLFCIDDTKDADADDGQNESDNSDKSSKTVRYEEPKQPAQDFPADCCTICRKPITEWSGKDKSGNPVVYSKEEIIKKSTDAYHAPICMTCILKKAAKSKKKGENV